MRGINNITRGVNRLGINAGKPAGLPSALRAKFLFLWSGKYDGDNLKDDLGGAAVITVTDKDWTTSFIPPTTAATFAVPDNATFLAADGADDYWFNASDTLLQKTHADLIASTTTRTFIKYADTAPHNVIGIGILKAGETLTDGEKIKLNRYFRLWAEYWGELMDSGYVKSNRIVGEDWSSYWATRTPSDLIVTGMRDTEIDFSWTDNSSGDCSFKIYKSTDGINYTADGTTLAGDTSYTATGLTAGNLYYFHVVGVKSGNESPATNIYDTRFKITVDTTKAGSAADTFVLPTTGAGYNAYIDWGDGGAEQNITGTPGNVSHTYAASGTYQIKIRGAFPRIYFNNAGDKAKLMTIDNWGNIKWSSMTSAFHGCSNLSGTYLDNPNTAAVTSMYAMFNGCYAFNQSVANFNTAAVKNMYAMFNHCYAFNQSVANFNTAAVTDMSYMFNGCSAFNQSVANFNTAAVTSMKYMFNGCTAFKQSLATFSLASVTDVGNMLLSCNINATGTTTNYDDTLVAWAAADVPNSLNFHGGTSKYSAATGAAARASLMADDLWTITDGGQA